MALSGTKTIERPETVWVLLPDYGTQGLAEPFMVFLTKESADSAKELIEMSPSSGQVKLCQTPVWKRD